MFSARFGEKCLRTEMDGMIHASSHFKTITETVYRS